MNITLTTRAVDHIKNFLYNRSTAIGIRIGVRSNGCSGIGYTLEYLDAQNELDIIIETNGIIIAIDPTSMPFIVGTELDFIKDGLKQGFKFNNPNVKAECGCGESFTV